MTCKNPLAVIQKKRIIASGNNDDNSRTSL